MEKYRQLLTRHLSRIVLVLLAVLLAMVYWFRLQEDSFEIEPERPPGVVSPDPVFTEDDQKSIANLFVKTPMEESRLSVIGQFNIFDAQSIARKEEDERKAAARFVDAQKAFDEGKLDLARSICDEIRLKIYPPHLQARDLLAEMKKREEAEAKKNATPTPPPPGAAPAAKPSAPPAAGASPSSPAPAKPATVLPPAGE